MKKTYIEPKYTVYNVQVTSAILNLSDPEPAVSGYIEEGKDGQNDGEGYNENSFARDNINFNVWENEW